MKKFDIGNMTVYQSSKPGFENTLIMRVDQPNYDDQVFVIFNQKPNTFNQDYVDYNRFIGLFDRLFDDYVYMIDEDEEVNIIIKNEKYIGDYANLLSSLGFHSYELYSINTNEYNKEDVHNLVRLFNDKNVIQEPEYQGVDKDNSNEYALYVILRNDISRTDSERVCDIAELSARVACQYPACAYIESPEWQSQVVILQASAKDLFVDNIVEKQYDNKNLNFVSLIKSERKVGHANYALDEAQVVGVAYFGKKCEMPKFVRKLPLWRF